MKILHISSKDDWQQATVRGEYLADSLESEGFIHCSRPEQVEKVANSFYTGLLGLVLLYIDTDRLIAEVKWEAADGDEFPHVYGPINLDAVLLVEEFSPDSDGKFQFPMIADEAFVEPARALIENDPILADMILSDIKINFEFQQPYPMFGDLFEITGKTHPKFISTGIYKFSTLSYFGFTQVDDYYGIPSGSENGDDTVVWLSPVVDGQAVYHHTGPYTDIQISFNVLRNPVEKIRLFYEVIERIAELNSGAVIFVNRKIQLGQPPDLQPVKKDIADIVRYWQLKGITLGSKEALSIPS